jgi:hypothetical protein
MFLLSTACRILRRFRQPGWKTSYAGKRVAGRLSVEVLQDATSGVASFTARVDSGNVVQRRRSRGRQLPVHDWVDIAGAAVRCFLRVAGQALGYRSQGLTFCPPSKNSTTWRLSYRPAGGRSAN